MKPDREFSGGGLPYRLGKVEDKVDTLDTKVDGLIETVAPLKPLPAIVERLSARAWWLAGTIITALISFALVVVLTP